MARKITSYVVDVAGINTKTNANKRLVILTKKFLQAAITPGTPENAEARARVAEGFFFVDGTAYSRTRFTRPHNPLCDFAGSCCPSVKIPM